MENRQSSVNLIDRKLAGLRRAFAMHVLRLGLLKALTLILSAGFLAVVIEGFRYFSRSVRGDIRFFFIAFSLLFMSIPLVWYRQILRRRVSAYDDYHLAGMIGADQPDIQDDLLNALQLKDLLSGQERGYSADLVQHSLERIAQKIASRSFENIVPVAAGMKVMRRLLIAVFCIAFIVAVRPAYFKNATVRLLHPEREYSLQLPFSIESIHASFGVLGGDTARVAFQCQGRRPRNLTLEMQFPDYVRKEIIPVDSVGRSAFSINNLRHDVLYFAYMENHSPFIPWRRINSPTDTIRVINRPEILKVKTRFIFPEYTGLPDQVQETNSTEFNLLTGTKFHLEARVNKKVREGHLRFTDGGILPLSISGDRVSGSFSVRSDDQFEISVSDARRVVNLNPIKYRLRVTPDAFPAITLLSPKTDLDLTAGMEIPLGIRISDDFGFTRAAIRYRLIKKYADYQNSESEAVFPLNNPQVALQESYFLWNIAGLGLGPEDAVEFRVEVYDNDNINGPKKAGTATLIARFPSLNELFAEVNDKQDEIYDDAGQILERLETTRQVLEEVARELLKKPEMKWEQKKQIADEIKKTREAGEKISKLSEQLDDLIEKSRENQLFNAETLEKFSQLQEAFRDIMTPELREALDKLQEAIEKMDANEVKQALNNFKTSQEQFSQELDRLLKIFRRIKIEQSIDELVKRFSDLTERQSQTNDEMEKTPPGNQQKLNELAQAESAIKKDTETAQDIMQKTSEDMAEFPMMPNAELQQLKAEMQAMNLPQVQEQTRNAMRKGDQSQARQSGQTAQSDLQKMREMMENFRNEFGKRNMADVMSDFRRIMTRTMQLSQNQEELSKKIGNTPRQSDRIMDVAVEQNQAQQNLARLIKDLIDLSGKTFGVTPRISKSLGQAAGNMRSAVSKMEERDPDQAARSAGQATAALNTTALELMAAMQQLQNSGSSSGFENYLQQLQQMAGQQQGINGETQMLGMGSPGEQGNLRQLAARQRQVRQSLEQLQEQMQGNTKQSGDLGGIAKDMEEVIKDLQNNQVLRRTLERQQRILSRLLDAQKSLRTQDYKDERQSKTGADIVRTSPDGLPPNQGERRSLLQENLDKALHDGYSKEYENLIRRYFEELTKEPDE